MVKHTYSYVHSLMNNNLILDDEMCIHTYLYIRIYVLHVGIIMNHYSHVICMQRLITTLL